MLSEEQIGAFQRDGFVAGSVILSDRRLDELRSELDRIISNRGRSDVAQPFRLSNPGGVEDSPVWQVVNIWQASQAFRDNLYDPPIVEEDAQLAGETLEGEHFPVVSDGSPVVAAL